VSEHQPSPIRLHEDRFARLEAIEWWDQALLRDAHVLVIGAGALGNEVIKNLALLGIGNVVVADMDRVELSNLSRSILFRENDEGQFKAECAARAARQIYPGINIQPLQGNVLAEMGFGYFRWADVVIGALDNREARVFVNSACARVGRPWIDGGIEVLHGVIRGFAPPQTACYECTMSQVDWDLLNKRRSCSLLARRALAQQGTPTTPTTASIIAALQVQELVKLLHGREAMLGRGFFFDGATHSSYTVNYQLNLDCPWHEPTAPIHSMPQFSSATPLREIWNEAARRLGQVDALDFGRELVLDLTCTKCGFRNPVFQSVEKISEAQALCPHCGTESVPSFFHSVPPGSELLNKTVAEIGLPRWEFIWARHGSDNIGFELAGDNPFANGNAVKSKEAIHGFK
jgi:molybdopterin/thiamine biosynthesis adenylyltransferase